MKMQLRPRYKTVTTSVPSARARGRVRSAARCSAACRRSSPPRPRAPLPSCGRRARRRAMIHNTGSAQRDHDEAGDVRVNRCDPVERLVPFRYAQNIKLICEGDSNCGRTMRLGIVIIIVGAGGVRCRRRSAATTAASPTSRCSPTCSRAMRSSAPPRAPASTQFLR